MNESPEGRLLALRFGPFELDVVSIFVDFEQSLNFCIRRIRAALRVDASSFGRLRALLERPAPHFHQGSLNGGCWAAFDDCGGPASTYPSTAG